MNSTADGIIRDFYAYREEVAGLLGVKTDTYYRYESKVPMPHFLIPRFLAVTQGDINYLFGLSKRRKKPTLVALK